MYTLLSPRSDTRSRGYQLGLFNLLQKVLSTVNNLKREINGKMGDNCKENGGIFRSKCGMAHQANKGFVGNGGDSAKDLEQKVEK